MSLPWDNLQTFVHDWMKGLQEVVDSIAPDPGADNSMLPLASLPYKFDTTVYSTASTNAIIDGYTGWDKGYGYQPWLIGYRLNLYNNDLRLMSCEFLGKCAMGSPNRWEYLTNEDIEIIEAAGKSLYNSAALTVENSYPAAEIKTSCGTYGPVSFYPVLHSSSDIKYCYPTWNPDNVVKTGDSGITLSNVQLPTYDDDTGFWTPTYYGEYCSIGSGLQMSNYARVIAVFDNYTEAQRLVNHLATGNTNNDVINYTKSGSEYKLWYGDNYLIYGLSSSNIYNYQDLFTGTKQATDTINTWNPSATPIKTPTYDEVKHEDEPEDYPDDPWSGVSFSGASVGGIGAFAKIYYMTSTELANLRSWMASINVPEGFDPMAQIVSLSQVPVELSGDAPENVVFINSSAVYDPGVTSRAVDSGVATQQSMGLPIKYSLGSIDIERRMEERGEPYLDYDCQIELYLPLVGCFSLDTQAVMGRTITAEAVLDPISGTLAAYAWVEKDGEKLPIAYGSTTIGVDLPVSAQQYSISRAALKQANAQLGTSLLSSALTLIAAQASGGKGASSGAKTATGTNGLAAAGIREAGADYMKASQAGNVFGDFMQWGRTIRQLSYGNNTAISGSFGGSTAQWSYPFDAYVKIIRPRFKKPENYNHSQGVPCIKSMTIGECTGFIQCVGVDVSGITRATDLERQAIQAALCNGVYAGGGEE